MTDPNDEFFQRFDRSENGTWTMPFPSGPRAMHQRWKDRVISDGKWTIEMEIRLAAKMGGTTQFCDDLSAGKYDPPQWRSVISKMKNMERRREDHRD